MVNRAMGPSDIRYGEPTRTRANGSIPFVRVPVLGADAYIASTFPTNRVA